MAGTTIQCKICCPEVGTSFEWVQIPCNQGKKIAAYKRIFKSVTVKSLRKGQWELHLLSKSNFQSEIFSSFIPLLDYSWRFWEALFYSLLFQLYHNQLHLLEVHLRHTVLERINCLQGLLSQTVQYMPHANVHI